MVTRVCIGFAVLFSALSYAQFSDQGRDPFAVGPAGNMDITGQLILKPGAPVTALSVELCEPSGSHMRIRETMPAGSGAFFFSGVPSGLYMVRVTDRAGNIVGQEYVDAANGFGRVQIRLDEQKPSSLPGSVVSLAELSHKVPGKAQKEADSANKALAKKDYTHYISHLEKAVAIDPEFTAARKNLALAYLKVRQYQKGIAALAVLLRADPRSMVAHCALAAAYLDMHRYPDAENAAQRALQIDPSAELAHFLLGCSLAAQRKEPQAALEHLSKAAKRFPTAYIAAASIWSREGHNTEAKSQLQAYLESGDQDARAEAEDMLNKL